MKRLGLGVSYFIVYYVVFSFFCWLFVSLINIIYCVDMMSTCEPPLYSKIYSWLIEQFGLFSTAVIMGGLALVFTNLVLRKLGSKLKLELSIYRLYLVSFGIYFFAICFFSLLNPVFSKHFPTTLDDYYEQVQTLNKETNTHIFIESDQGLLSDYENPYTIVSIPKIKMVLTTFIFRPHFKIHIVFMEEPKKDKLQKIVSTIDQWHIPLPDTIRIQRNYARNNSQDNYIIKIKNNTIISLEKIKPSEG